MANFISISGPSYTGKSTLVHNLSLQPELSDVVFGSDMYETVWSDLVQNKFFSEWSDITTDSEYLCLYIIRLIDYYTNLINTYKDTEKTVILDGCWIDLAIYAMINLWYTRTLKELQEEIFARINGLGDQISRIYLTQYSDERFEKLKFRRQYRMANLKSNIPLERQYYNLFSNFRNSILLPSSDTTESSLFILDDLKNLGYL